MGKDKPPGQGGAGGQPAAAPAKPPELPANLPQDLRDFVECKSASVTLKDGPQAWVTLPDEVKGFVPKDTKPELKIEAGATPGTATITVSLGVLKLSLPATIKDGRLSIETTALPFFAPASIAKDLTSFVDTLNAWFKANGKGLAPPAFGAGQTALSKVPLAPATATPPPVVAPQPPSEYIKPTIDLVPDIPPTPVEPITYPDYDAMTKNELTSALQKSLENLQIWLDGQTGGLSHIGAILASSSPAEDAASIDREIASWIAEHPDFGTKPDTIEAMDAQELGVERAKLHLIQAALAAKETVAAAPAAVVTPAAGESRVRGRQRLGGPVILALVGLVALAAFIAFGSGLGGPAATLAPSLRASLPAATGLVLPTLQPTVAVSLPPAVISARFEITGDQKVSSCEHIYTVVFSISDSNGQRDIYAGKTMLYHVLNNEPDRTGTIGAGGKLEVTVDETFQKTNSGCFSHLQPGVTSVDGQPTF